MFKLILKFTVFICLILAAGQIPIGKETLGAYYIIAIDNASGWSVDKLKNSRVLAGIKAPKWLEDLFTRQTPVKKIIPDDVDTDEIIDAAKDKFGVIKEKIVSPNVSSNDESKVTSSDRERVMRLLE